MYPTQSKVEIFARSARAGWTAIGNEINGLDVNQAMNRLIAEDFACQVAYPVLESITQNL
jgi:N6-adenosine-specific RNA methylase IME4